MILILVLLTATTHVVLRARLGEREPLAQNNWQMHASGKLSRLATH
jgi:hypothetical protein